MTTSATAMRGGITTLAGQWGKLVAQLIGLAVLSRVVAPAEFGKYAMVVALAGLASVFSDFGLSLAVVRAPTLSRQESNNLFYLNLLVGAAAAAIFFALAPIFESFYNEPAVEGIARWLSVMFVINGLAVQPKALLNRDLRFSSLAFCEAFGQLLGVILAITIALTGYGLAALVVQQLGASLVTCVLSFFLARWFPGKPCRSTPMKSFLTYGISTTFTQAINYVSSNVDNVSIGRVWGSVSLGVYSRAYQIFALPLQQLAAPMTRVAVPVLARAKSRESFLHLVSRAHLAITYVLALALGALVAVSEPMVRILMGDRWTEASVYLEILAVGGLFQVLGYIYYWAFLATARMAVLLVTEGAGRAIMIAGILATVQFGPRYVAGAYAFGLFAVWAITGLAGGPRVGISFLWMIRASLRPVLLAAVVALVGLLVQRMLRSVIVNEWTQFLACAGASLAIGAVFILAFRAYRSDLRLLIRMASSMRRRGSQ